LAIGRYRIATSDDDGKRERQRFCAAGRDKNVIGRARAPHVNCPIRYFAAQPRIAMRRAVTTAVGGALIAILPHRGKHNQAAPAPGSMRVKAALQRYR
jgi:hypothetical protein